MAELCLCLYGDGPSFRHQDGPIAARVEVPGGTDAYCFDPERSRCRLEAIPRPDPHKWTDPAGVLALARAGRFGLRLLEDRLPRPADPPRPAPRTGQRGRRPYLPRDLGSCFLCGALVLLIRERGGAGFRLVTPSRPTARSARALAEAEGLAVVGMAGKGLRANRDHARDCLPLLAPRPPKKRGRGRPRLPPRPFVPLPWKVKPSP